MLSLDKDKSMFILPDFLQIQVESFCLFLDSYIYGELKNFPVIKDSGQRLEFKLLADSYRIGEPILTERKAICNATTYAADLYVPCQLTDTQSGESRTQTICLGSLPLMTSRGTFILNGISWTVVSQILRNPGIYYTLNRDGIYIANILFSDLDKRLKLELDKKGRLWVRIRRHKINLLSLLVGLGLDIDKIPDWLRSRTKGLNELFFSVKAERERELKILYNQLPGPKPKPNSVLIFQQVRQLCNQVYQLGPIGRLNLNNRLGLSISLEENCLLPQDLIAAAYYLIKVSSGMGHLDEIDHLKNKHVNSVADLLRKQLKNSLLDLQAQIRRAMRRNVPKRLPPPKSLMISRPFTTTFNQFFGSHELIQFLDQTNPLAEIAHKRKLSFLGPGGLTRRTASFRARDIHPSYYGRICPIETSEGMNAGVICSLATCGKVNAEGVIQNPLYQISGITKAQKTIFVRAGEDERLRIGTNNRLAIGQTWQDRSTSAQYQQEFIQTSWDQIHLRSLLPIHYFSVGACLIPFLEHDDANRALMGSNMQRQAVPLTIPEKPIVGTGLEAQVGLDSGTVLTAKKDGKIIYRDRQIIQQITNNNTILTINLLNYERSNNGTCIHHKPIIKIADLIRKGQLLADGATTVGGELSLGKNVLVAYMPWEGYNFEDAVLINERLIDEDIYTSLHIEKYEISAQETDQGVETITRQIPHLEKYVLRHLDKNGLVCVGSWVITGDVLVGKLSPLGGEHSPRSPEGKLLKAIFGVQAVTTRESCLKVPPGGGGLVIDVKWITHQNGLPDTIHVYILQSRKIQVGDKIAGRHGNKGIVSRILPRQDMPYLQDGTAVDMVLSPLGVPSRMNVGQLFECLLGLAGNLLNKHYRIMPFDERYEREASRKLVFSELYKAKENIGYPWLFEPNSPGKSQLFDGRTGEVFDQPVLVGKAYMMKLIHMVDDKIHARSSGPYALVTQQPLRGRSNRGGQRVGEMEVWALEGFGAAHMLQEMLTIKSDHVIGRSKVLGSIVSKEIIPKTTSPVDSFKLLIRELRCLGLEIKHHIISQNDLVIYDSHI
uniref:DNA-directed RNA polymerase subunit beta n=1 Tax=Netrium digitus TaxID=43946 RepID=A0A191T568_9VIRI|nr:beta subunit of RNA polymerase [Netrium digitus]ANI25527.1 beta subunit of RNA polymerase [Netrium digitus]